MASKNLKWNGKAVRKKVIAAVIAGTDETMAAAVIYAKQNHKWKNRTAVLEGSISIAQPAKEEGAIVTGVWGSLDVVYALRIEYGFKGLDSMARLYDQPAFPFLRPSADKNYPDLPRRIRANMQRKATKASPKLESAK